MTEVLGIKFSEFDINDTVDLLDEQIDSGTKPYHVVTANPEIVMHAKKDRDFNEVLEKADLITPDGIGIILASRILNQNLQGRVPGYDLLHALLHQRNQNKKKTRVYALGGQDEVIKLAARNLRREYEEVEIVGYHHGYFAENSEEEHGIVSEISDLKPDLLLVGIGSPRQENFIYTYKNNLQAKVAMGCGGTFDILSGTVKRAPLLIQNLGLEWLYRLVQQPSRWKRQLNLPNFLYKVYASKN
jgi:N-acetylglucosaminyldiphosphoundecaprenol N-acetyl-beta-D-mannosaminyltransferase